MGVATGTGSISYLNLLHNRLQVLPSARTTVFREATAEECIKSVKAVPSVLLHPTACGGQLLRAKRTHVGYTAFKARNPLLDCTSVVFCDKIVLTKLSSTDSVVEWHSSSTVLLSSFTLCRTEGSPCIEARAVTASAQSSL